MRGRSSVYIHKIICNMLYEQVVHYSGLLALCDCQSSDNSTVLHLSLLLSLECVNRNSLKNEIEHKEYIQYP